MMLYIKAMCVNIVVVYQFKNTFLSFHKYFNILQNVLHTVSHIVEKFDETET